MTMPTPKKAGSNLRAVNATPPPAAPALLDMKDDPPVEIVNADGTADLLLICEHASNRIPKSLGLLGLDANMLQSHIAWDPGAEPVARLMSKALNAPLILQRFSRLVYDCNRPPEAPSAMPERSEIFEIPGNKGLSSADREARTRALYVPFHQAISDYLDSASATGRHPAIVTIHSFTPVFHGRQRTVELGLLHDRDARLVDIMLNLMGEPDVPAAVERNQPYGPEDGVTHTLQRHALPRGLPNVMIEIRNDLLDPAGQARLGAGLARMVGQALERLGRSGDVGKRQAVR